MNSRDYRSKLNYIYLDIFKSKQKLIVHLGSKRKLQNKFLLIDGENQNTANFVLEI